MWKSDLWRFLKVLAKDLYWLLLTYLDLPPHLGAIFNDMHIHFDDLFSFIVFSTAFKF